MTQGSTINATAIAPSLRAGCRVTASHCRQSRRLAWFMNADCHTSPGCGRRPGGRPGPVKINSPRRRLRRPPEGQTYPPTRPPQPSVTVWKSIDSRQAEYGGRWPASVSTDLLAT